MFNTLLIITLFLLASLLVCLLTLRMSINIKHLCLFLHSRPILTDFLKFQHPLIYFSSVKWSHLAHQYLSNKQNLKNLYLKTFFSNFDLLLKRNQVIFSILQYCPNRSVLNWLKHFLWALSKFKKVFTLRLLT